MVIEGRKETNDRYISGLVFLVKVLVVEGG
jgi:hypothetical protein